MTLIDLKINDNENTYMPNIYYNNTFINRVSEGVVNILTLKTMASNNEFDWFKESINNVNKELMNWKK